MNRSSIFHIKIDFDKSSGSYLFDKVSNRKYLDFFGMYSSIPLGYNHPIFLSQAFREELLRVATVKISNCEMLADESAEFNREFSSYVGKGKFEYFHYCCTGAMAIEAAIKTAMDYKKSQQPKVISFKENFHGIYGYGGWVTSRSGPSGKRLEGYPRPFWPQFDNPVITYDEMGKPQKNLDKVNEVLTNIEQILKREAADIAAILVEPIQCTYGEQYFAPEFFQGVRTLADQYDVPLIFDEIQTGFGGSGKVWYFEHLDIEPDIVTFGKKAQLSGIMAKRKFANIFDIPNRLEATWDADLVDMVRCKYILRTYQKDGILDNVNKMGKLLVEGLAGMKQLENTRGTGLLIAFDFDSKEKRDKFFNGLRSEGLICNPTLDQTMRFRPNLNVSSDEINHALEIIRRVDNSL